MTVFLNVAFVGILISSTVGSALASAPLAAFLFYAQFSDQVQIKYTSQLINGISRVI